MPLCRHGHGLLTLVLSEQRSNFRVLTFWDGWIGNAKIRGLVCAKVCDLCILGEQRAKRVDE